MLPISCWKIGWFFILKITSIAQLWLLFRLLLIFDFSSYKFWTWFCSAWLEVGIPIVQIQRILFVKLFRYRFIVFTIIWCKDLVLGRVSSLCWAILAFDKLRLQALTKWLKRFDTDLFLRVFNSTVELARMALIWLKHRWHIVMLFVNTFTIDL